MIANINATCQVFVMDNFLADAMAERALALHAEYGEIIHNGLSYPGISLVEDPVSIAKLSEVLGCELYDAKAMYRRYVSQDKQSTFIHVDSQISHLTNIIFLNLPEQCYGGTMFWKHREFGWEHQPTTAMLDALGIQDTPEFWQKLYIDGFDEDLWEPVEFVAMKFNRLLTFPATRFHSRYPKDHGFGSRTETARLIKVFFVKVRHAA